MRNILEDLYHGNISVTERTYKRNSAFGKALGQVNGIEDALRAALPEDKRGLVEQYSDAHTDMTSAACVEDFVTGLRMGVRFILSALDDDDGCFTPIADLKKDE